MSGVNIMCPAVRIVCLMVLLLPALAVQALEEDRFQPVYVEADSVEIDEKLGVGVYKGAVRFVQGSIELFADEVTIHREQKEISKVIAKGDQASVRQQLGGAKGEMKAQANRIEYVANQDRIYLYGDARLVQGGDEFKGDYIEYGLQQESVVARSEDNGEERVKIVIQPRESDQSAAQAPVQEPAQAPVQTPAPAEEEPGN